MAWIYFQGLEESHSPFSRGYGQSPIVKMIDMHRLCCLPDSKTGTCLMHQSGTTCEACKDLFFHQSTSFPEDSHARISALLDMEKAWEESEADLYLNSSDSFANADLDSFSWKTSQLSLFGGLTEFCWNSMRYGMMHAGRLFQPQKWGPRTYENESGFLPTLTASEYGSNQTDSPGASVRMSLNTMARRGMLPTLTASEGDHGGPGRTYGDGSPTLSNLVGGQLSPVWSEWFMGYPIGWTELGDSEMQWYQSQRGKRLGG